MQEMVANEVNDRMGRAVGELKDKYEQGGKGYDAASDAQVTLKVFFFSVREGVTNKSVGSTLCTGTTVARSTAVIRVFFSGLSGRLDTLYQVCV